MRLPTGLALVAALALLAACAEPRRPDVAQLVEPEPIRTSAAPPEGSDPDACYGQDVTPAVIETVTEQAELQPDAAAPATYHTETRQRIVEERREVWFETLCARQLTPDFVASLQRALKVRGYYDGPVNGQMTGGTRRAIRGYQKPQGLDSAILSLAAARQLGLARVERQP
jgi:hypothetical protein